MVLLRSRALLLCMESGSIGRREPNLVRFITLTDGRVNTPYAALIGQDV